MNRNYGFSLIELSVVIVIVALLMGALSSGRDLIRQSELRSIMTDLEQHRSAYKIFVQTYGKAPGDFQKGSLYWPNGSISCASGSGTCNGNGDGMISYSWVGGPSGVGGINENLIAMRQMKMAGILDFPSVTLTSSIYDGSSSVHKMIPGENIPKSKREGAGYFYSGYETANNTFVLSNCDDTTSPWTGEFVNSVYIGRPDDPTLGDTRGGLSFGALTAQEAFEIDMKMDDAQIVSGNFRGRNTGKIRILDGCNTVGGLRCYNVGNYNINNRNDNCLLGLQVDD